MYTIPQLPLLFDIETKSVLKKAASAHSALAELKGVATGIPNQSILISTLSLQEAKDSSEIENIITTHDEIFRDNPFTREYGSIASKEVHKYGSALREGFESIKKDGFLSNNHIIHIHAQIEGSETGFRKQSGTVLKNETTGEIVYTPPQTYNEIQKHMNNLELFINNSIPCDWDTLVKMAVIHHQFESIHPFYDGNGRAGRIINILYLVKEKLLDIPILYLSKYISNNKAEYYMLLQKVRTENSWEEWILFILDGIEKTSKSTTYTIERIKECMQSHKHSIRKQLPKIYSQDLLNNIYRHPYTKIQFLMSDLSVTRQTASRYLDELTQIGIVTKHKLGKDNFYINNKLFDILTRNSFV